MITFKLSVWIYSDQSLVVIEYSRDRSIVDSARDPLLWSYLTVWIIMTWCRQSNVASSKGRVVSDKLVVLIFSFLCADVTGLVIFRVSNSKIPRRVSFHPTEIIIVRPCVPSKFVASRWSYFVLKYDDINDVLQSICGRKSVVFIRVRLSLSSKLDVAINWSVKKEKKEGILHKWEWSRVRLCSHIIDSIVVIVNHTAQYVSIGR